MKNNFFNHSVTNIYSKPSSNSDVSSQILYGEKFKILSKKENWIKIKTSFDNYVGFIKKNKFNQNFKPTNKICKLKSRVFKRINNKFLPTNNFLYFASAISIKKKLRTILNLKKINGLKSMIQKKLIISKQTL